jgi:hypothetical protein
VAVAEAAGDAAVEFDEAVDGFGAAVAGAVGVEVGQERALPAAQGLAEPGDLGDRAGRERAYDLLGGGAAGRGRGCVVDRPDLLRTTPRQGDLVVAFVGLESLGDPGQLAVPEESVDRDAVSGIADAVAALYFRKKSCSRR